MDYHWARFEASSRRIPTDSREEPVASQGFQPVCSTSAPPADFDIASAAVWLLPAIASLLDLPYMDLPSIRRAVAHERDRLKKLKRRRVSPLALSHWCLDTALCIVISTEGDLTAAADWLASPHRRGGLLDDSLDRETVKVELKRLYDELSPAQLAQWADPSASPLKSSCLQTALRWSYGYKLKQHVRTANVDFGAPVRSVRLIEQYNRKLGDDSMDEHIPKVGDLATCRGRKWCMRWRTLHGGKVASLRSMEPVSLTEKRKQALPGRGKLAGAD